MHKGFVYSDYRRPRQCFSGATTTPDAPVAGVVVRHTAVLRLDPHQCECGAVRGKAGSLHSLSLYTAGTGAVSGRPLAL
jgi:hypothetical protein